MFDFYINHINSRIIANLLGAILVFHSLAIENLTGEIQFIELIMGTILLISN